MRPDQLTRLQELSEKLADTFILEADPAEWPGSGKPPADMTSQERGDAYWSKKNAMATGGVLRYTLDLVAKAAPQAAAADEQQEQDEDLDKQIREAEKRAKAAVARVIDKAKFDKRVHGKQS
jgi:hypothetical protein